MKNYFHSCVQVLSPNLAATNTLKVFGSGGAARTERTAQKSPDGVVTGNTVMYTLFKDDPQNGVSAPKVGGLSAFFGNSNNAIPGIHYLEISVPDRVTLRVNGASDNRDRLSSVFNRLEAGLRKNGHTLAAAQAVLADAYVDLQGVAGSGCAFPNKAFRAMP